MKVRTSISRITLVRNDKTSEYESGKPRPTLSQHNSRRDRLYRQTPPTSGKKKSGHGCHKTIQAKPERGFGELIHEEPLRHALHPRPDIRQKTHRSRTACSTVLQSANISEARTAFEGCCNVDLPLDAGYPYSILNRFRTSGKCFT